MVVPRHRTGMHSMRTRSRITGSVTSPSMISPSRRDRAIEGSVGLVGLLPQQVVAVEGLARRRPDLAEHDEGAAVLVGGHEQQQVGEAEVGQQAPRRDQPLEMALLRWGETGSGPGDVGEAGHRPPDRTARPGQRQVRCASSVVERSSPSKRTRPTCTCSGRNRPTLENARDGSVPPAALGAVDAVVVVIARTREEAQTTSYSGPSRSGSVSGTGSSKPSSAPAERHRADLDVARRHGRPDDGAVGATELDRLDGHGPAARGAGLDGTVEVPGDRQRLVVEVEAEIRWLAPIERHRQGDQHGDGGDSERQDGAAPDHGDQRPNHLHSPSGHARRYPGGGSRRSRRPSSSSVTQITRTAQGVPLVDRTSMRRLLALVLTLVLFTVVSCSNDDEPNTPAGSTEPSDDTTGGEDTGQRLQPGPVRGRTERGRQDRLRRRVPDRDPRPGRQPGPALRRRHRAGHLRPDDHLRGRQVRRRPRHGLDQQRRPQDVDLHAARGRGVHRRRRRSTPTRSSPTSPG